MRERDVVSVVLPDSESHEVLVRQILPMWTKGAARQERPVAVFVAGQPGSGKTQVRPLCTRP